MTNTRGILLGAFFIAGCAPANKSEADGGIDEDTMSVDALGSDAPDDSGVAPTDTGDVAPDAPDTKVTDSSTDTLADGAVDEPCPPIAAGDPKQHTYGVGGGVPLITADETWKTGHVYYVISTFEVRGATLTIEAGARVCMSADGGAARTIIVSESASGAVEGKVFINGTAAQPVVFDRLSADDQYSGFVFNAKSEARFDHVVFKNGGSGGSGVLSFQANHPHAAVLRDVHLKSFFKNGLYLGHPAGLSSDSSVFVDSQDATSSDPVVRSSLAAAKTLGPGNLKIASTIPTATRAIELLDNDVVADLTLLGTIGADYIAKAPGLVVRRDTGAPIPNLTLEAGARVRFETNAELIVGSTGTGGEGSLAVNGTVANPVVLRGATSPATRGQWGGVTIYAGGLGTTTLRNLVIEDAGGYTGVLNCRSTTDVQAGVKLRPVSTPGSYAGPTIENLKVVRSGGDGLAFYCVASTCLTTDYAAAITGSDNAGVLVKPLGCP